MTNFGSTLQAVMLGMTGVRLGATGSDPRAWSGDRTATLPAGWDSISYKCWLAGKQYSVVARHGSPAVIAPVRAGAAIVHLSRRRGACGDNIPAAVKA